MRVLRQGSVALLFLMIAASGFAQSAQTAPSAQGAPAAQNDGSSQESPSAPVHVRRRSNGPPCWKQAGMTPDMVNQRWKIEDQQKANIAAVCSEPSTSPQQKHDKIEQIQANTKEAIAKLVPAETLAKFNKCEADLEKSRPASAPKKQLGPCGGTLPTGSEHDHGSMPMNH